jgi:hypothetical protein
MSVLRRLRRALPLTEVDRAERRWAAINKQTRLTGCPCGRPATVVKYEAGSLGNVAPERWTCAEHEGVGMWAGGVPYWEHPTPCPAGETAGSRAQIGGPEYAWLCPHREHADVSA